MSAPLPMFAPLSGLPSSRSGSTSGEHARSNDEILDGEFPDELPEHHEMVRGMLVRKAMPRFEHGDVQGELRIQLRSYDVRRGGSWWFSNDCEVELARGERYLPDLAGWDSGRVTERSNHDAPVSRSAPLPSGASGRPRGARVRTPPQWVCEVLSPSTAQRDLGPKQATYHAAHVEHYWLLDPDARTLTVLAWAEDGYRTLLTAVAGDRVRAAPFDAVELDLGELFGD